jgi:hypothetical protein
LFYTPDTSPNAYGKAKDGRQDSSSRGNGRSGPEAGNALPAFSVATTARTADLKTLIPGMAFKALLIAASGALDAAPSLMHMETIGARN